MTKSQERALREMLDADFSTADFAMLNDEDLYATAEKIIPYNRSNSIEQDEAAEYLRAYVARTLKMLAEER